MEILLVFIGLSIGIGWLIALAVWHTYQHSLHTRKFIERLKRGLLP